MAGRTLNTADDLPPDAVVVRRGRQLAERAIAVGASLALVVLGFLHLNQAAPDLPEKLLRRFSFPTEGLASAAISPDGRYIAYAAEIDGRSSLWLRTLATNTSRELEGTEGGADVFWSPENSSIGFRVGSELRRISIDGGSPLTLCRVEPQSFLGGTWSPDGERIVFSSGLRLYAVTSRGGQPRLLFDASDSPRPVCIYPHFLPPDDAPKGLVYSAAVAPSDRWVAVLNMETGERRELGPGSGPVYSRDGYLIHGAANRDEPGLWAWPFSLKTLETTGDAFPISTDGFAATVSYDGTLAYLDRPVTADSTLVWLSRKGERLETVGQPQPNLTGLVLSPDFKRVAVTSRESGNYDIWVHDLPRSTKTRLTFEDQVEAAPTWSPSGEELAYRFVGARGGIMRRAIDGTGDAVPLLESDVGLLTPDWSRDGRYLVYDETNLETKGDIRYIEFGADGATSEPVAFSATSAFEHTPRLSSDGRFLAYVSNESGRDEVYLRPFPEGEGRWQASVNGGRHPRWRSDGEELYYIEAGTLMAVSVSSKTAFTLGRPQPLFEAPGLVPTTVTGGGIGGYEVSVDGQRFLTVAPVKRAKTEILAKLLFLWADPFVGRAKENERPTDGIGSRAVFSGARADADVDVIVKLANLVDQIAVIKMAVIHQERGFAIDERLAHFGAEATVADDLSVRKTPTIVSLAFGVGMGLVCLAKPIANRRVFVVHGIGGFGLLGGLTEVGNEALIMAVHFAHGGGRELLPDCEKFGAIHGEKTFQAPFA